MLAPRDFVGLFIIIGAFFPQVVECAPIFINDESIRSIDLAMALGRGYDNATATVRSNCLEFDENSDVTYVVNSGYRFREYNALKETTEDFFENLPIILGKTYLQNELQFEDEKRTSDKHYISVGFMFIDRESTFIDDSTPLNEKARALWSDKKDYVGFFKACGPGYIKGIKRDQEVVVVFKYKSFSAHLASEFSELLEIDTTPAATPLPLASRNFCTDPGKIRSRRSSEYCITPSNGNVLGDLVTWKCGGALETFQNWLLESDGRIRSNVYNTKCISIGTSPQESDTVRLTDCDPKGVVDVTHLQWIIDEYGRLQNKQYPQYYIGIDGVCDGGTISDGTVLKVQGLNDPSQCTNYNQQYWYTLREPIQLKNGHSSMYCVTLDNGDVNSDLITRQCGRTVETWQNWLLESDGRIRSGVDNTKCISIGTSPVASDAVSLDECDPTDVEDITYLQWVRDDDGRLQNKKFPLLYIGINGVCDGGDISDGTVLETQTIYDISTSVQCIDYSQQFWHPVRQNDSGDWYTPDIEKTCCENSNHVIDKDNHCCDSSDLLETGKGKTKTIETFRTISEPGKIKSRKTISYCITVPEGNVSGNLNTWRCDTLNEAWQNWLMESDGRIRSAVDNTKCISIGTSPVASDAVRLDECDPTDVEDISYLQWIVDKDGRLQNRQFPLLYIGINGVCLGASISNGSVLEAQAIDKSDPSQCTGTNYKQQFWFALREPTEIKSGRNNKWCMSLARGNISADLITWRCGRLDNLDPRWQKWYIENDGRIRSGVDFTKCISLGTSPKERTKPRLDDCYPTGISDTSYLQWIRDEDGRLQNKKFPYLYIGISSGCFDGVKDGDVLEAQVLYDDNTPSWICPKFNTQFWRPKSIDVDLSTLTTTSTVVTPEYVCKTHVPVKTTTTIGGTTAWSKFSYMTSTLQISIRGYGIALDQYGSEALYATSLDHYNDIMNFVFVESKNQDVTRNYVGLVYGIYMIPWVDNVSFQQLSGLTGTTVELITELVHPEIAPCSDPIHVIDKNNICCHPNNLYDYGRKEYSLTNLVTLDGMTFINSEPSQVTEGILENSVDGDQRTSVQLQGSSSDTQWYIYLGGVYEIKRILIHRGDTGDQNDEFEVIIYDGNAEVWRDTIIPSASASPEPVIEVLDPDSNSSQIFGSRVKIRLDANKVLRLNDVEIYGYEISNKLEIRSGRISNQCITLARGNVHNEFDSLISWKCGSTRSKGWQQWYYTSEGHIRSRLDRTRCLTPRDRAFAQEAGTFILSACIDANYQKWEVDEDGRIKNKEHNLYIGVAGGCYTGVKDGDVLEYQIKYNSTSEFCSEKYNQQFWDLKGQDQSDIRCRITDSFNTTLVRENLMTNAEFISRMDAAIRKRQVLLSNLQGCISATKYIPEIYDYNTLQNNVFKLNFFVDEEFREFTLAELKTAIDPFDDYSLFTRYTEELDEYMSQYVTPCMNKLQSGGENKLNTDHDWLLKTSWETIPECSDISCLTDEDTRWSRTATGGCVPGWLTGRYAASYNSDDSKCKMVPDFASQECHYKTTDLNTYHTKATNCWSKTLPDNTLSYIINNYCLPQIQNKRVSSSRESELRSGFSTECAISARRRLMLRKKPS